VSWEVLVEEEVAGVEVEAVAGVEVEAVAGVEVEGILEAALMKLLDGLSLILSYLLVHVICKPIPYRLTYYFNLLFGALILFS
jgi:hypothetical protein